MVPEPKELMRRDDRLQANALDARSCARWIGRSAAAYGLASLTHFVHNATYISAYPNLPADLTPRMVFLAWLAIASTGLVGYLLYRRGRRATGSTVLAIYGVSGFAGLLHYARAPPGAHSLLMNGTIWMESVTGAILLLLIAGAALDERVRKRSRGDPPAPTHDA